MKELIIIPSYKPNSMLIDFLGELEARGIKDVLIVDDGSGGEYREVYNKLSEKYPNCEVIRHAVNLGKGRAIKTGLNHALNKYEDLTGVVVCDSDGQHPADTVKKAAEVMREHPDKLILAARRFLKGENVPVSNFLGNMITILVFRLLTGLTFSDTQCGLRAFPRSVMGKMVKTEGERFEYENIMLLDVRAERIDYCEIPMPAVYFEDDKKMSHFNKIKDSFLIYKNILRFAVLPVFAGLMSYLATILFFEFLPICSLIKTGLFYGGGLLVGWLISLIPVSEDKGRWYTILYPVIHAAVFSALFYWLLNYMAVGIHGAWWLTAIPAAPTGYAIYLRLRYGKKPRRIKIK